MKRMYKILLVLCTIVLLTGAALGYPGYSTNSANDTTKSVDTNVTKNTTSADKNQSVDTNVTKNTTTNVTGGVTSTDGKPTATVTKEVPTTVQTTTVKSEKTKPTVPEATKGTPGFEIGIAIGMLSVVYIFGKFGRRR